jgi:cytochrome c oxidase subunit III
MATTQIESNNKIHPYKMLLWVGFGSIVMMFAGLTSAYIVKKSQANWLEFDLPNLFWFSTLVILVSSFTIQMAVKKAKAEEMDQYRGFLSVTAILGITFIILQLRGFQALELQNVALTGVRSNSAGSFLLVISGLHLLHLVGGVIAIAVISLKARAAKSSTNQVLSVELVASYWHFVDILWIYLFVFLNWVG